MSVEFPLLVYYLYKWISVCALSVYLLERRVTLYPINAFQLKLNKRMNLYILHAFVCINNVFIIVLGITLGVNAITMSPSTENSICEMFVCARIKHLF